MPWESMAIRFLSPYTSSASESVSLLKLEIIIYFICKIERTDIGDIPVLAYYTDPSRFLIGLYQDSINIKDFNKIKRSLKQEWPF